MDTDSAHRPGLLAAPSSPAAWRRAPAIALLALACPVLAIADCVDTRRATAAEADFHARALAAALSALPPVPAQGKLQNADQQPTLGTQCQGKTGDFTIEVSRFYELNNRKSIVSVAINATRLPSGLDHPFDAYGTASPNRSAGLRVHNVAWRVSGSDSPLRQALADAIDRQRLQGWVGKALPTVADSQAVASQAVAPTVAGPSMQVVTQPAPAGAPVAAAVPPATPGQAAGAEPIKDAVDAVNKLRGLFGR